MMNKNNLLAAGLGALFVLLLLSPSHSEQFKKQLPAEAVAPAIELTPPPEIEGVSALAFDLLNENILYEKNKSEIRALASLTKILSSLIILEQLNLDEEVIISKHAVSTEGLSSLIVGAHFLVKDLLAFVMVESSNDAVEALVEHLAKKNNISAEESNEWFLNLMRDKTQSFGAATMMFYNPTGLDLTPQQAGAYGSAEDMIKIVKATLNSELWQFGGVSQVISQEGKTYTLKPTDTLAADLNILIGGKTGFTDIAGGNLLVIVQYPLGKPIAIVVLGSTEEGRFGDVKAIYDWIKIKK